MKLITAIIKPFKLEDVKENLADIGIDGMTVTEVKGFGRPQRQGDRTDSVESSNSGLPRLQLDTVVPDDRVDDAIRAIITGAKTGKVGDGKIFIREVVDAIRIRTGETGLAAI